MKTETRNAIIESATMSIGRGGMIESYLHLDYGGSGQGFGGYCLYSDNHTGENFAGHWMYRCMVISGVSDWDNLIGKTIRVRIVDGLIQGIGHIVKDDWFIPHDEFKKLKQ